MSVNLQGLEYLLKIYGNLSLEDAMERLESQQQEIDRLKAENEKLRELLSLVWDYCRVDDNAVTEADLERKAYECREVLGE